MVIKEWPRNQQSKACILFGLSGKNVVAQKPKKYKTYFTSNIPTLQRHSGVGHSRDTERVGTPGIIWGWSLQRHSGAGIIWGWSLWRHSGVGHTLGLGTQPELSGTAGCMNSALGFSEVCRKTRQRRGEEWRLSSKSNSPTPRVGGKGTRPEISVPRASPQRNCRELRTYAFWAW